MIEAIAIAAILVIAAAVYSVARTDRIEAKRVLNEADEILKNDE